MPIFIFLLIGGGLGGGGFFYGRHQHKMRVQEKAAFDQRLAAMEEEIASLISRLGKKDKQVRALMAEVENMRRAA
jgi:hypothetical protein